jgi:protein SCO1
MPAVQGPALRSRAVPTRLALALLTLTLCAVAAVIGVFVASRGDSDARVATGASGWAGYVRPPGARAPDFALRDQDGVTATMAEYRGRPVAVTFVYSTCEDTCPALVDQVRGALDDSGSDMPLLAVSVDPANDTPARARRFLNERRMTGRARFLLGSARELAPVWNGYGVQPQEGELDHTASVVLVDAQGRQRVGFPHDQLTPEALAHDIRRLAAL